MTGPVKVIETEYSVVDERRSEFKRILDPYKPVTKVRPLDYPRILRETQGNWLKTLYFVRSSSPAIRLPVPEPESLPETSRVLLMTEYDPRIT